MWERQEMLDVGLRVDRWWWVIAKAAAGGAVCLLVAAAVGLIGVALVS